VIASAAAILRRIHVAVWSRWIGVGIEGPVPADGPHRGRYFVGTLKLGFAEVYMTSPGLERWSREAG